MAETCTHLDTVNDVTPSSDGCEDCLRIGGRWVQLRLCGALIWAGITMAPGVAAILMSASTIVVALNARLLRRVELRPPALDEASRA